MGGTTADTEEGSAGVETARSSLGSGDGSNTDMDAAEGEEVDGVAGGGREGSDSERL